jgi:hypothetical protein
METVRNCRSAASLVAVTVLSLAGASATSAQNLLTNPEFDGYGTSGLPNDPFPQWNSTGAVAAGEDADGCPNSDSHRQEPNSVPGGGIAADCVQTTPGETLYLEVTYRSTAPVDLGLLQASDATCTTFSIGPAPPPPSIPPSGDWTTVRLQTTVAASRFSVFFRLRADADAPYVVEFDRAYLGREERVFADDFDGGSFCRWSGVVSTADV